MMRVAATALAAVALLGAGTSCPAQAAPSASVHTLDRADLESWLDGLLPYALQSGQIAGAVVSVVHDDEIILEKGYGFADVAKRKPMDAHETLIRPGSISKLFTWTVIMQLLEQGKLDLDTDVNRYLDFKVPSPPDAPITLRRLMTHVSGFEEDLKGLIGPNPSAPLGDYLKAWVPRQLFPPGSVPAYSNYGAALAGYIIERVSGESFEAYTQQHILLPLAMSSSSFQQPVPAPLSAHLSCGYVQSTGPAMYQEIIGAAPAGALAATAHDMAHFMSAHLHNGAFGSERILASDTAVQMHATQPKVYPALNGMALGFYETSRNSHRVIAHNGGTQYFHSDLHLFIDDGVGIFISLNSAGRDEAVAPGIHRALFEGFADRYFPAPPATMSATLDPTVALSHAQQMAGVWENSRRSGSNFFSLLNLVGVLSVTANADGTITLPVPTRGAIRWREIAPYVWQEVGGVEKIQAIAAQGRPRMLGFGMAPPAAFLPVPAWRSPTWILPAVVAALAVLVCAGLSLPIAALVRRRYRLQSSDTGRPGALHRATRILALSAFAVFSAFALFAIYLLGDAGRLSHASDPVLILLQLASFVVFPAAAIISAYHAYSLWAGAVRWHLRIWPLLIALSCATLLYTAAIFHLMKISTHY